MATKKIDDKKGKRANGDGSLRQRKDGTWEGRYTAGADPITGKPIRKSIYGKKKTEVAERLRKITSEIDSGDYSEPSKITLKQWFDTWFSDYMGDKKPLTIKQYKSMSETHIYPSLGAVKLSKLNAPQLTKFYNQLAKDGKAAKRKNKETGEMEIVKTGEPSSPKTIKNVHGIISKALDDAVDQGLIKENVAQRAKLPRIEPKEIEPLTEEQQKAFFNQIKTHKYKNLYSVIIFTGLREAEAIGLTWDCIDFQRGTLKVYRQLQKRTNAEGGYQFAALKNDKTRVIKLSPYVLKLLEGQKAKQTQTGIESIYVFSNQNGEHLSVDSVYACYKRIVKKIGIPEARVHDLRHTFAVNSLQEGDDFKTVQDNLGHATAAFTLNVYGHVSDRMKEESAKRQQAFIARMGI